MLKENQSLLQNLPKIKYSIDTYPDKEPDRYLNDFFKVNNINDHLLAIFTQLYYVHQKLPVDLLWEPLLENFHYHERKEFSQDLRSYIFLVINREVSTQSRKGKEIIKVPTVRKYYISMVVQFIKLFLRNHLIRQDEFNTQDEYEQAINRKYGYYFLDIAFHDFAIGKTFPLSGRIKCLEQDTIDILGRQNAIMEMEDDNGESFDFEIDKSNYNMFKKKLEKVMMDRIFFIFEVSNVVNLNHTQGKIKSL